MLPANATLRSILPLLADEDAFVSKAFGVLHRLQREQGDRPLVLRVGITGTGQYPNYRIDHAVNGEPLAAIDGGSHGPWPGGEGLEPSANWSDAALTYEDVRGLLGEIRGR